MKNIVFFALILVPVCATAKLIVVEPDDYVEGTDLSSISPHVTLSTEDREPVYSATIDQPNRRAADGNGTQSLGRKVFSLDPDRNSEWYYWPDQGVIENALMIEFAQPVDYFSLFFAELFSDGGCCFDDPVRVELFDSDDRLIDSLYGTNTRDAYLGELDGRPAWPVWTFSSELSSVSKVIVGGESEPTSIDRLSFRLTHQVNEPGIAGLLFVGLLFVFLRRRTV